MIEEKRKQREQELGDSISLDHTPSPPSRYEKSKRAHKRKGGEFTSETTCKVAEKIISRFFFQQYYLFWLN